MAMPLHALSDHLTAGDVEGGKQRRRAMTLVVVRHGPGAALFQRQAGLGAVGRLDLALLVDGEHQRLVRRVEIEPGPRARPGDVGDLVDEMPVVRQ